MRDNPARTLRMLSVVVPCHNEEETLPSTHERLSRVLQELVSQKKCSDYEILYVNNGSTDNTIVVLEDIFRRDQKVRIVSLRRNFGFQGSISAGLFYAQGQAVVTIDADLQDPPEKIGEMISYYQKDYDLVLGVRKDRSTDSFLKRFFAQSYYRALEFMGVEVVYNHGDFRLMDRALVDEFNRLPERNRLIRAMILKLEARYAVVTYDRAPRTLGRSKFSVHSLFSLSLDGITSFSCAPLRLASIFGVITCCLSMIGVVWAVYIKVFTNVIPGWASTFLPIMAFGGFQLLVLGIIGEYIGRLYVEVKHRPLFIVRKEYTHSPGG